MIDSLGYLCVGVLNNNLNHDILAFGLLAFEKVVVPAKSCKILWINPYVKENHQLIFFPQTKALITMPAVLERDVCLHPLHFFILFCHIWHGCFIP